MYYNLIEAENATDAFQQMYRMVDSIGEIVESRIGKTKHLTDVSVLVKNPYQGVCLDTMRNLSLRYLMAELHWYFSASNKVADIAPYAKMWSNLTDDGETLNSAYGYRIKTMFGFDQLEYCVEKLKVNPYDRQAVIHIKDASNTPTKDTPCTCLIQFTVYQGRLNAHTYMRSNDIWLGTPYDIAFFTALQQIVSRETGIPCGEYWHTVGDLHLYEKHWKRPVKQNFDYSIPSRLLDEAWDITEETEQSILAMRDGEEPENLLLKQLWRINHER